MNEMIFLLTTTLMYATPLIFASMGGVFSEKSGVINIGLEGMMTIGAFSACWAALHFQNPWMGLLAGALAGMILAIIHGIACINFKGNQVVSGVAINFIGSGLSVFLCRLFFDGASMTPPLDLDKKLPLIFNQYASVYIAFAVVLITWFVFSKTVFGLRLISIGEHPEAAKAAGIRVKTIQHVSVLISGFLAGLGGASLSIAIVSNFRATLISGQGFIAIAAMIFGRWRPVLTMFCCLFFGFSQALVVYIGGMEGVVVSSQLLSILPYVLTLIVLVLMGRTKGGVPSALGVSND